MALDINKIISKSIADKLGAQEIELIGLRTLVKAYQEQLASVLKKDQKELPLAKAPTPSPRGKRQNGKGKHGRPLA